MLLLHSKEFDLYDVNYDFKLTFYDFQSMGHAMRTGGAAPMIPHNTKWGQEVTVDHARIKVRVIQYIQ